MLYIFISATAFRELPYIIAHKDENGERVYEMKISQPQVKVNKVCVHFGGFLFTLDLCDCMFI